MNLNIRMKNILTIALLFVGFLSYSQWTDNFTDGDFTNTPAWIGQSANFEVDALNQLHIIAPAVADTSYLSVPSTAIENATWEFYVNLDFGTSSGNLARVYLSSNNSDLKGSLNGYFVMIGNTADEVSLYRQDGTTKTMIIDGVDGLIAGAAVTVRVQVTRDAIGNWELLADNTGGSTFVSQGLILDNNHFSSAYAGVHCKYTATRSAKFYFDDFVVTGSPFVDNVLPFVQTVSAISNTEADVLFSEDMNQASVEIITKYTLDNGIGNPISVTIDGANAAIVHLSFGTPFTNNTSYFLTTTNVDDLAANTLANSVDNFLYFIPETPIPGDVLITEFMVDPTDSVGLIEQEYVEIYNNSNKIFDLNGWTISDASSSVVLPSYVLTPGEYVLIAANGWGSEYGVLNYVEVSLPSYNNSGDDVILKSDLNVVTDSISYDLSWYANATKEDGGWSIERKRLSTQCSDSYNWSASENANGGTPGIQNSVSTDQADVSAPFVTDYIVQGDTMIIFEFDELIAIQADFGWIISPSLTIVSTQTESEITASIITNSMAIGTIYTATLTGVKNCWTTDMIDFEFQFGLPDSVEVGDVVINEVMFNPATGGSDYIEIVNVSDKVLSLKNWKIADIDEDTIANIKTILNTQKLFLPGDYIILTEDSSAVIGDFSIYGTGTFLECDLPTYPNDSATVVLISNNNVVLDQVHYDEDYHFELLTNTDGKALERISFTADGDNENNWHTASELVEWGTPGYLNSQFIDPNVVGDISIDPPIFSPDNDGYQDVVLINYQFTNPDNVMDVQIYDSEGRLIRELEDNLYPGVSGLLSWDGINDEGTKAQVGAYVILITIFDLDGNRTVYKEVVVLAVRL
jgi:hypothetical protein